MRYEVSLLPFAEEEIEEAFHWYFERSPYAASAFRSDVIAAIDSLAEDPTMWADRL
jgi:plasmid stabilization system protein ParE